MANNLQQQIDNIAKFLDCSTTLIDESSPRYNRAGVARNQLALSLLLNRPLTQFAEKILSRRVRQYIRKNFLIKPIEKPEIEEIARKTLIDWYADDVARVRRILNRPLPWSNFPNQA